MKLTPFGKLFIVLVALGVLGFVGYRKFGDQLKSWSGANTADAGTAGSADISKDDFTHISDGLSDAPRNGGLNVNGGNAVGEAKLSRPLKVGINTWAGHAPGIVANGGLNPGAAASLYKKKYGLDVQFVLLEDPTAKLAAFIKGDIDVMWDTVDSFIKAVRARR